MAGPVSVSPMRKRKAEEMELEVGEVSAAKECVTIHGVVTELSPVKCSKKKSKIKYFTGKLSDGKKTMRMVSFEPSLRSQLHESLKLSAPVAVTDCQVKPDNFTGDLEIVAPDKRSKVQMSPRKFKLPENFRSIDPDVSKEVLIEELENLAVMQHVSVRVKALFVGEPESVKAKKRWRKLMKQECVEQTTLDSLELFCGRRTSAV